jgi:SAM-dependent methyltransferase
VAAPGAAEIHEIVYRLDGPLRWALGEAEELVRRAGVRPGDVVLDVGAGTGYLSLPLARAVGASGRVFSVDRTPELLEVLAAKAERQGLGERINPVPGSALELDFADEGFDRVFSTYLLHELDTGAPAALREMYRVLRPLGTVTLADYRRIGDEGRRREIEAWYGAQADGGGESEEHLRFTLGDVERMLLDAGFRNLWLGTFLDFHLHATATK